MTNPIENQPDRILDHVAGGLQRGDRVLVEAVVGSVFSGGEVSIHIPSRYMRYHDEFGGVVDPQQCRPIPPVVWVARDKIPNTENPVQLFSEEPQWFEFSPNDGHFDAFTDHWINKIPVSAFVAIHGPDALPAPGTCRKMRMFAIDAEGE